MESPAAHSKQDPFLILPDTEYELRTMNVRGVDVEIDGND